MRKYGSYKLGLKQTPGLKDKELRTVVAIRGRKIFRLDGDCKFNCYRAVKLTGGGLTLLIPTFVGVREKFAETQSRSSGRYPNNINLAENNVMG